MQALCTGMFFPHCFHITLFSCDNMAPIIFPQDVSLELMKCKLCFL